MSEPRLLITSEKERQVFVFENTVAFARKIELGQAKFKYEYKFRVPVSFFFLFLICFLLLQKQLI